MKLAKSVAEFRQVLVKSLAHDGVDVIDLEIDYSDNDRVLNNEIRQLSAQV